MLSGAKTRSFLPTFSTSRTLTGKTRRTLSTNGAWGHLPTLLSATTTTLSLRARMLRATPRCRCKQCGKVAARSFLLGGHDAWRSSAAGGSLSFVLSLADHMLTQRCSSTRAVARQIVCIWAHSAWGDDGAIPQSMTLSGYFGLGCCSAHTFRDIKTSRAPCTHAQSPIIPCLLPLLAFLPSRTLMSFIAGISSHFGDDIVSSL